MEQYNGIKIYTESDFAPGITIGQARQQLEATKDPSLILYGTLIAGVNIRVGEHTRSIADVISALTQKNEADASGTKQ